MNEELEKINKQDKNEDHTEQDEEEVVVVKEKYWSQYLAVISATIISTLAGVNFGWPSPSIPLLINQEYPNNFTREECSYIALTAPIGTIIGGPISAYFVDLLGRKRTILLVAVPQILSLILIYFYDLSKILLYIARFLGGIAEGANFTISAMYIGEIASPKIRGVLASYISVSLRLGLVLINVIGSYNSIKNTSLIFLSLPIIFLISFSFMPESPYYLIMKNKTIAAKKALKFLRRRNDVEDEFSNISKAVERQINEPGTFKDLFTVPSNRKAMLICLGLRTFQQLSGVSGFSLYAQLFFTDAIENIPGHISAIIYNTCNLLTSFLCSVIIDKTGRKPLLIFSSISCVFLLLFEGIFFTLRDHLNVDVSSVKWLPLVGMLLFTFVFAVGLGTIVNIMLGELFPQPVKSKALCLMNVVFAVNMMIATKFYQFMSDNFGLAIPFYVFSFNCFVGIFFCWLYVPETKNKTLEQIQLELKGIKKEGSSVNYKFES